LDADRRQPQRRLTAARAARPGAARPWPCRPAETATQDAARRPRLRPRQVPPTGLEAGHQTADRPPPDRTRLNARPTTLGRRTHLRLAPQPPPPARPHRSPRRHPRRLPRPQLLPHLLATTGNLIQLELLRPTRRPAGVPLRPDVSTGRLGPPRGRPRGAAHVRGDGRARDTARSAPPRPPRAARLRPHPPA
jgi:hypothetical protein